MSYVIKGIHRKYAIKVNQVILVVGAWSAHCRLQVIVRENGSFQSIFLHLFSLLSEDLLIAFLKDKNFINYTISFTFLTIFLGKYVNWLRYSKSLLEIGTNSVNWDDLTKQTWCDSSLITVGYML